MKKSKKKINIKALVRQLLLSALYLLIFAAIGAFIAYNSVYGNPDKTVEQVYGSYEAGSWTQFYNLSTVEESKLVNLTTFVNAMQNARNGVDTSSIKEEGIKEEDDKVVVTVSYNSGEETKKDTLNIVKNR